MSELTLHPTPRFRDVVREQIRAVGLSLRVVALVVAVVVGIVTLLMLIDILRGSGETWFDSDHWAGIPIVTFLLPLAVWWREKRFGSAFLWTLPVDRRQLALAKVFGGWVWMTIAQAMVMLLERLLAAVAGLPSPHTLPLIAFTFTTATYLVGSALVLGLRHPLRWLFGAAGLLFVVGNLSQMLERLYGVQTLLGSRALYLAAESAGRAWLALPDLAQWAIATVFILGLSLIAVWAAASRHRERR